MAMIVITIRDKVRGVEVQMMDEPRVEPDQTEFTDAQRIGAAALNAIQGLLDSPEMNRPRLIVVGADGLPN